MDQEAERRRQALLRFMKAHKLKRGTLARRTGITPNIIYNFLNGKSTYLSQPTLDRIAQVFSVPVASLTGEDRLGAGRKQGAAFQEPSSGIAGNFDSAPLAGALTTLKVKGTIIEGRVWAETIFVESESDALASFNLPSLYALKSFAIRLATSSMEALLPSGAVLACVAAADYLQRLRSGDIVIVVQRNQMGLFQTSVRQYVVEGGAHYITSRPLGRKKPERLDLQAPLENPMALGQQDFFIHAVVLAYAADLPAARR